MSRKYKLQKHLAVAVLYIIRHWHTGKKYMICLLYTSDAADEQLYV